MNITSDLFAKYLLNSIVNITFCDIKFTLTVDRKDMAEMGQ